MFKHTHISGPKMFAKLGWQTETVYHKTAKEAIANPSQTDYNTH